MHDAMKLGAKEFVVIPKSAQEKMEVSQSVNVLLLCGGSLPNFEQ